MSLYPVNPSDVVVPDGDAPQWKRTQYALMRGRDAWQAIADDASRSVADRRAARHHARIYDKAAWAVYNEFSPSVGAIRYTGPIPGCAS